MRLLGLLISLAILAYVIVIYMNPSQSESEESGYTSRPKETVEHAREISNQLDQAIKQQQENMQKSD